MKKLISFSLVAILFGLMFLSSCTKEDPAAPEDPGNTDPRLKFNGHWAVTENSQTFNTSNYFCDITNDSSNTTQILFAYLYGFNVKTYATISGNNFSVPSQIIQGTCISGNGVLANSKQINMTCWVQSSTTSFDTVTFVLTK